MKILAIDTATDACSAALWLDGEISERYAEAPQRHAGLILPMVDELLAAAGLAPAGLDALAFGRGPGSFTGLRIAAGVVQGLALGSGVGVAAVSDLAALAQRAVREVGVSRVLACLDARLGELYWGSYAVGADGRVAAVGPERLSAPDAVEIGDGRWFGAGPGFAAAPTLAVRLGPALAAFHPALLPSARDVLTLALPQVEAGALASAAEALPVYLRDEVAWRKA